MYRLKIRFHGRNLGSLLLLLQLMFLGSMADQGLSQTGTFIDRDQATDLRVVSYNVLWDSIFPSVNPFQAQKFGRVVSAVDADIWNLQEIDPYDYDADDVVALMNTIAPLGGGATWYGHKSWDNVILSKYPLLMLETETSPKPDRTSVAMALVDLPDAQFDTDFYFMNNHFKCCLSENGWEDGRRQEQADALVNWMRDARTPGGNVNLPADTPMAVVGDLNMVGSQQPLNTLLEGNIIEEVIYGSDSPPDWDGSNLTDAHPMHNGTESNYYTWRNDGSSFDPGILDYVLYTDSVVDVANSFVLNTVTMSSDDRTATGLQQYDVTITTLNYDHLPVVVDFRFPSYADSDFNESGTVDGADLAIWEAGYGTGTTKAEGDGDGDGIVSGSDFLKWQRESSGGLPTVATIPEPHTGFLFLLGSLALLGKRR